MRIFQEHQARSVGNRFGSALCIKWAKIEQGAPRAKVSDSADFIHQSDRQLIGNFFRRIMSRRLACFQGNTDTPLALLVEGAQHTLIAIHNRHAGVGKNIVARALYLSR